MVSVIIAEQIIRNGLELRRVIRKSRRAQRAAPDQHRTLRHQITDSPQNRQCHVAAASAQIEHPIAHAGTGVETFAVDLHLIEQHIRIDEVESVARRHIDVLVAEQPGERRFLAVEIRHIAEISPLLQKIGAAGHVGDPGLRIVGPVLQPIEELTENEQRQPRRLFNRLMHGGMHDDAVDAQREFQIDNGFQLPRRVSPWLHRRCQRFRSDQILAVDMRHRGSPADIGDVGGKGFAPRAVGPHRGHRNGGVLAHLHVIAETCAVILQRLGIVEEVSFARHVGDHSIMISGQ